MELKPEVTHEIARSDMRRQRLIKSLIDRRTDRFRKYTDSRCTNPQTINPTNEQDRFERTTILGQER